MLKRFVPDQNIAPTPGWIFLKLAEVANDTMFPYELHQKRIVYEHGISDEIIQSRKTKFCDPLFDENITLIVNSDSSMFKNNNNYIPTAHPNIYEISDADICSELVSNPNLEFSIYNKTRIPTNRYIGGYLQSGLDETTNYNSYDIINKPLTACGLDGDKQVITILDEGVDTNHPFFSDGGIQNRKIVKIIGSYDKSSKHGTHLAGVALGKSMGDGVSKIYSGVAESAKAIISSNDLNQDLINQIKESSQTVVVGYKTEANDDVIAAYDMLTYSEPNILVISPSGNEGDLGSLASAKNVLTVGSTTALKSSAAQDNKNRIMTIKLDSDYIAEEVTSDFYLPNTEGFTSLASTAPEAGKAYVFVQDTLSSSRIALSKLIDNADDLTEDSLSSDENEVFINEDSSEEIKEESSSENELILHTSLQSEEEEKDIESSEEEKDISSEEDILSSEVEETSMEEIDGGEPDKADNSHPVCVAANAAAEAGASMLIFSGERCPDSIPLPGIRVSSQALKKLKLLNQFEIEIQKKDPLSSLSVSSFSTRGKTNFGNMKPEIVIPGEGIVSARAGATTDDIDSLTGSSGTSSSAAAAGGLAAIVSQFFKEGKYLNHVIEPSAPLIKAVIINSARPITGNRQREGFGVPCLEEGLGFKDVGLRVLKLDNFPSHCHKEYIVNTTRKANLSITMTFNERPIDARNVMGLNVDLIVITPTGERYYGNNLKNDIFTTSERVRFEADLGIYHIHLFSCIFSSTNLNVALAVTGGFDNDDIVTNPINLSTPTKIETFGCSNHGNVYNDNCICDVEHHGRFCDEYTPYAELEKVYYLTLRPNEFFEFGTYTEFTGEYYTYSYEFGPVDTTENYNDYRICFYSQAFDIGANEYCHYAATYAVSVAYGENVFSRVGIFSTSNTTKFARFKIIQSGKPPLEPSVVEPSEAESKEDLESPETIEESETPLPFPTIKPVLSPTKPKPQSRPTPTQSRYEDPKPEYSFNDTFSVNEELKVMDTIEFSFVYAGVGVVVIIAAIFVIIMRKITISNLRTNTVEEEYLGNVEDDEPIY